MDELPSKSFEQLEPYDERGRIMLQAHEDLTDRGLRRQLQAEAEERERLQSEVGIGGASLRNSTSRRGTLQKQLSECTDHNQTSTRRICDCRSSFF